jgi:predicted enzyme related to lactoylglutathione lyase
MPKKLKAKIALVNVPSDNPDATQKFYSQFLGIDLARSLYEETESYHAPISSDGIDLTVNPRHSPQETPMVMYAVDNLDHASREVENLGGERLWGPESLPIAPSALDDYRKNVQEEFPGVNVTNDMGRAAIFQDPGGTQFGLVQLAEHAHGHFATGRFSQPLTDKQERIHKKAMESAKKVHS